MFRRREKKSSQANLFASRKRNSRKARSFRPCVEQLEHRRLLAGDLLLVTTEADDNGTDPSTLSLREAITAANSDIDHDTIEFARGVRNITLSHGELLVTEDLTIQGRATVSGNHSSRVFNIGVEGAATPDVSIAQLRIVKGLANETAAVRPAIGGGILVNAGSSLTVNDSTLAHNRAVGHATTLITPTPVFTSIGGAIGGGIANFGTLTVVGSTFRGNEAIGADGAVRPDGFPAAAFDFPGNALGGAIDNLAIATVTDSRFIGNAARAGDDGQGAFAAISVGGAVYNDATLTVNDSEFKNNKSIGGDDSISPSHNGHALGGGIGSGTLGALFGLGSAELVVNGGSFEGNRALGGHRNKVLGEVVLADVPNSGLGGAINVYQGTADISHVDVHNNRAIGGAAAPDDGDGGLGVGGGPGVGGGVFFFNFVFGITGNLSHSSISGNRAVGGRGATGLPGGAGMGGGVAVGALDSLFGGAGDISIAKTLIKGNLAQGGRGGRGASGGNGQGGGIGNLDASALDVHATAVLRNRAIGGRGGRSGDGGNGQGGGIFNAGSLELRHTLVIGNWAIAGQGTGSGSNGLGQGGGIYNSATGTVDWDAFTEFFTFWNHATDDDFDDIFGF